MRGKCEFKTMDMEIKGDKFSLGTPYSSSSPRPLMHEPNDKTGGAFAYEQDKPERDWKPQTGTNPDLNEGFIPSDFIADEPEKDVV